MLKYNFNEQIFSKIDSNEKAYWIGFLYADGYIHSKNNTFGCALKQDDKQHLINMAKFLEVSESDIENIIHYNDKTKSYKLYLTRKTTYEDLIKLGFTSHKSCDNNDTIWNNIPDKYKKDFILGLWDGDGCFSITPKKSQIASIVSNNEKLLQTISQYINENLSQGFSKVKLRTQADPYPRINFRQNKAKIFGDWLYQAYDKNYCLDRKYQQYLKMEIHSQSMFGFDNASSKGVLCLESGQIYGSTREAGMKELQTDNPNIGSQVASVCNGRRKSAHGKTFRYLTQEEKERYLKYGSI